MKTIALKFMGVIIRRVKVSDYFGLTYRMRITGYPRFTMPCFVEDCPACQGKVPPMETLKLYTMVFERTFEYVACEECGEKTVPVYEFMGIE